MHNSGCAHLRMAAELPNVRTPLQAPTMVASLELIPRTLLISLLESLAVTSSYRSPQVASIAVA